jgi:hypothetical protein
MLVKLIKNPKKFLVIYISCYTILFFIVQTPVRNNLPVIWMITTAIFGFSMVFRGRDLYEYVSLHFPKHRASCDPMLLTFSKKVLEKDRYVNEQYSILKKFKYVTFTMFIGFVPYQVVAFQLSNRLNL